jgi:hypothetical protein
LSRCRHARDADDLARMNLEGGFATRSTPARPHRQVLHLQHRRPEPRLRLLHPQQHPATDHQLGELLRRGVPRVQRRHHLAAPHHRDPVGGGHDLPQLVGDQDNRLASLAQGVKEAEQCVRLRWRQHGRRLIEDQDLGAAEKRLDDLHPLLEPDGQVADARVRVEHEAVVAGQPVELSPRGAGAAAEEGAALGPEHHVLQDGQRLDQHEVLVDHADPGPDGVGGRADGEGTPFTRISPVSAS